jgi:DNA repair protein SbcD/Mre11
MKIFHAADIHLGRRRLDGRLPDSDIAQAFRHIAMAAVREQADVFLLAGDLFDRAQVEPMHLRQAQETLTILKNEGIPVIAVEGNHDRQSVHGNSPTWVNFLAEDNLLVLLRPEFNADGARLEQWNRATGTGAWHELAGVRFVGAGYLGAATPHKVRQIVAELDDTRPQVLLLHAGPEYFVGEGGGFSKEDLALLRKEFCYLALGHIHKPMIHDGWACNPGSPENCDLREASYCRTKNGSVIARGYAVVEIDLRSPDKPTRLEIRSNPRRPCHRLLLDCTPFGNKTKNGAEAFVEAGTKTILKAKAESEAVVELVLHGALNFNRIALDTLTASEEIARAAGVFAVSIDPSRLNLTDPSAAQAGAKSDGVPREELERRAILAMLNDEALWGLHEDRAAFASLFYDLKEAVQRGAPDDAFATLVTTSPLIDKVRAAQCVATPSENAP